MLLILGPKATVDPVTKQKVDVSFRPPPPPPEPARIENPPPPPPPKVKAPRPKPVDAPVVAEVAAPAPGAAAMLAPKEVPKTAAPEASKENAVAAINVAVGGTGDGTGTAVGKVDGDDSAAPVVAGTGYAGPVNLPEDADPPEPSEDNEPPEYPEQMRATGQEARVVLKVVIDAKGRVGKIQVLKGEEPFIAAAIAAVKGWVYEPARLDGQAIAVFKILDLKFRIRADD